MRDVVQHALHPLMAKEGFKALKHWASGSDKQRAMRLDALRELPLLIRRHGLRRTLGFWLESTPSDTDQSQVVARAFALALEKISGGTKVSQQKCGNPEHMLQTQLALEMADQWVAMAQAMLEERAGAAQQPDWLASATRCMPASGDAAAGKPERTQRSLRTLERAVPAKRPHNHMAGQQ